VGYLPLGEEYRREIADNTAYALSKESKVARRRRMGLRPISQLVGSWLTKATIGSWSERTISHTGIENGPDSYGGQQ
jgi:hypothetical protein